MAASDPCSEDDIKEREADMCSMVDAGVRLTRRHAAFEAVALQPPLSRLASSSVSLL